MAATSKGGRPHKGDRDLLVTRPPRVLADVVRQQADAAGLSISEYVALVLAEHHDMASAVPARPQIAEQGVLPLGRTA